MLVNRTSITSFLSMNLTDLINTDIAHNYPWTLYTLDNFSWTVISLMIPITDTICFVRPTLFLYLLLIWDILDSLSNPCFHPMIYANWQIYFESWSKKTWSKAPGTTASCAYRRLKFSNLSPYPSPIDLPARTYKHGSASWVGQGGKWDILPDVCLRNL